MTQSQLPTTLRIIKISMLMLKNFDRIPEVAVAKQRIRDIADNENQ